MGLCITRKPQEKVLIGEHVVLTVLGVSDGRVMLHFEAPAAVSILRPDAKRQTPPTKNGRRRAHERDDH